MSPVEEPVTGLHSRERFAGLREKLGSIRIATALAYLVLLLAVLWAVVPGLFSSYDPIASVPGQQLRAPNLTHFFGTDALGRDVFSRVVHGSVHSLSGAFIATAVGFVVGTALGLLSGSAGGIVDEIIMRIVDVLLSIPALLLALTIIILLGFGTLNASIAVGVSAIAAFARLMRSEVIRVRASDYVEAAIGSGGTLAKVLWRHVLPNALTSVVAFSALQFGSAILQLSTLSFLGYGAPPPTPEWGLLVAEGRNYVATAWWLTAAPGLVVVIVVLAANQISKSMRSQR
ncbi:peptide/nickel transport system permease protein [Rhizobium sp. BIGb0125]|uniref:ABC transporter permease n=1 Tax=Rhizobium sp. BIGb0125 TaxID=2940618 RepID=UPI00216761C4|nr:ABC transporter permease [Rhizobium sp. BIGb0125]MCS4244549.1 peptide/nickel transport system permease protein [Rhizobium sp. BIGb0125]